MSELSETEKFFRERGIIGNQALASLTATFGRTVSRARLDELMKFVQWACVRDVRSLRRAIAEFVGIVADDEAVQKGLAALANLRTFPEPPTQQTAEEYLELQGEQMREVTEALTRVVGKTLPIWFFPALAIVAERAKAGGADLQYFALRLRWHLCDWGYEASSADLDLLVITLSRFYDFLAGIANEVEPDTWLVRMGR